MNGKSTHASDFVFAVLIALTLCLCPSVHAQSSSNVLEAAKKEGRLVWYEAMSQSDANAMVQQFNKQYPFIKVEIFRLGSAALLSRVLAEHQANKTIFDAVSINTASLEIMKEKGMLAKYVSSHTSFYPRGRKDEDGYWTGIYMNTRVIGYNTRLVPAKSAPMSYQDLLQPRWRGEKLGLEVSQPHWYGSVLYIMGPEKGLKFLKDLAAQNPYMTTGLSLTSNLLAAGEFPIQVWAYGTSIEELKEKQAPVDWTAPNPTIVGTAGMGLARTARNPNAARLFYEWMLSREGQEALVAIAKIPSRSGVSPNPPRLTAGLTFYNQPENPMNKAFEKIATLVKVIFTGAPGNAEALTKEIFSYGWPKTEDYISRSQ
jgi:iron(III) transport system substrate-binding protein